MSSDLLNAVFLIQADVYGHFSVFSFSSEKKERADAWAAE